MPKELSASQREFFKDSRIRSKDGRLLVMYHGSNLDFDEFSTPLAWFSNDRRYASEYGSRIYACYLDCRRPFVCGDTSLPLFDSEMSADDVDAGFMQAFSMGDDIDDVDFEDDAPFASSRTPVPSRAAEALRAKAKIGKAEFDAILKDVKAQYSDPDADPNGWELRLDALTRSTEFKDALAARGYDSIAAREEGHFCVAAFRPESIKLVSNANPTRSRKIDEGKNACKAVCGPKGSRTVKHSNEGLKSPIRPSRGQNGLVEDSESGQSEEDSDGRSLSDAQSRFFAKSKVRDSRGRLKPMYHGAKEGGSDNPMKVSTQAELDEFLREFDEALSEPAHEEHWVEDVMLEDFDKGGKARKLTVLNEESHSKANLGVDEDIEVHDALNPALFDGDELKPEVKEAVKRIADEFVDMLRQDGIKFMLKDIVLVGSNMSYNYTKDSDLDIHLIADSKTVHCPDGLYPLLYSAYRSMFNSKYDITIKGIPAEVYVEVI